MKEISGGYCGGVPPLPIPNREVKPDRADGTAHPRESRSPPFYKTSLETRKRLGALLCLDDWGGGVSGGVKECVRREGLAAGECGNFGGRSALPRVLFEDLEAFRGGDECFGGLLCSFRNVLFSLSLSFVKPTCEMSCAACIFRHFSLLSQMPPTLRHQFATAGALIT